MQKKIFSATDAGFPLSYVLLIIDDDAKSCFDFPLPSFVYKCIQYINQITKKRKYSLHVYVYIQSK